MKTLLLLLCLCVTTAEKPLEVRAPKEPGKLLTPLYFALNTEFYRHGVFAGTLPEAADRTDRIALPPWSVTLLNLKAR